MEPTSAQLVELAALRGKLSAMGAVVRAELPPLEALLPYMASERERVRVLECLHP